ncbi:hypothetical protein CKAN_02281900 [Cinnamomum micranthum f. kanehirae]|uniref:Reverse transcriptase zinc-binding domain-containing protein n=1 Tax=Cinnamomum micranthum f. kanehirae TaxID=337451 RepID=A0A443PS08_9MAGN|nr:hypothetical protein CKAN_02281900 [Cinnamomum micranthum f. kanehirae]
MSDIHKPNCRASRLWIGCPFSPLPKPTDFFEEFSLTTMLSLPHTWEAVRSRILQPPWAPLVWSYSMNPKLSWRLLHRKCLTVAWAQSTGVHLAGSCPSCFKHNESDCSIFFYGGSFSAGIWKDLLLSIAGTSRPYTLSAASVLEALNANSSNEKALFFFLLS